MVLNDRPLTNQKDGLSNSLNLTDQDFYICLVDEKNKENNLILTFAPLYGLPCRLVFSLRNLAVRFFDLVETSGEAVRIMCM